MIKKNQLNTSKNNLYIVFINNFIYFSIKFWNYLNDTYVNKNLIYDVNLLFIIQICYKLFQIL